MRVTSNAIPHVAPMVQKLWPEHDLENMKRIIEEYAAGEESAAFTEMIDGEYAGVAMCCLRHDYVEGCETSPVGYLEGIYVEEKFRMAGVARSLCRQCEEWAKEQGCSEFASDCELTNETSLKFHLSIGFDEENRIICFRKNI